MFGKLESAGFGAESPAVVTRAVPFKDDIVSSAMEVHVREEAEAVMAPATVYLGTNSIEPVGKSLCLDSEFAEGQSRLLIDTGSPFSFIHHEEFVRLGYGNVTGQENDVILRTVDGKRLRVFGKATLEFRVREFSFVQEFVVADLKQLSGLLGMDFLEDNDVTIFVRRRMLGLPGGEVGLVGAELLEMEVRESVSPVVSGEDSTDSETNYGAVTVSNPLSCEEVLDLPQEVLSVGSVVSIVSELDSSLLQTTSGSKAETLCEHGEEPGWGNQMFPKVRENQFEEDGWWWKWFPP